MSSVLKIHTRVGIFTATEVQIEAMPGEWVRDDEASTEPVTTKMNDFLDQSGSYATFVSPPTIELRAVSEAGDRRTYFTSVSLIYIPEEEVYSGANSDDFTDYSATPLPETLMGMESGGALPPELAEQIMASLSPVNATNPQANAIAPMPPGMGSASAGMLPADLTEKIVSKLSADQIQEINTQNAKQARSQKARKQKQVKAQPEESRVVDGDVPLRGKSNVRSVPKLPRLG